MVEATHIVMRLLVLPLVTAVVNGQLSFDITFKCKDLVCFHLWELNMRGTIRYVTLVSNGEIQTVKSQNEGEQCSMTISDLSVEDVGRYRCRQEPDAFTPENAPVLTLIPGKATSLQCVYLAKSKQCLAWQQKYVTLTWVDAAGVQIQEDSQHQIKKNSPCDIMLTLILQSPGTETYRCQATIDGNVQTSADLQVRVPARKGKGRGIIVEENPKSQGGSNHTVGVTVGVLACAALTAMVALFVVKRRKPNEQMPDESCYTFGDDNVMNADDVIYADIVLPEGSDGVCVHGWEPTEYACVQYK